MLLLLFVAACDDGSVDDPGADGAGAPGAIASKRASLAVDDVLPQPFRELWLPWKGDLEGMVDRRVVRIVTAYGGYQFYYDGGQPRGAIYELTERFEDFLNEKLERRRIKVYVALIPVSRDQLIPSLLDGHADIVAADLTITRDRSRDVSFTEPLLNDVNEVVVTGPSAPELATIYDLPGATIHVRRSSSYYEHLQRTGDWMRHEGLPQPDVEPLDELLEAEDILEMVSAGMIGMTVLDDYKAEFWSAVFPDIEVRNDIVVHEGGSIAWATRQGSPELLATLNDFLDEYGRGTLIGNDTYNRYLDDASDIRCADTVRSSEGLTQLADVFREYGDQYGFDWLKLAAQGFQESRFNQARKSSAGAVGIMQIKPSTAADPNVGIDDVSTADNNIHAGTRYMRFLADRYFSDEDIDGLNQWLLTLAAYNAGPARVIALRKEARENGYDPDLWFDNVEIIAARRIGRETVTYVSNIYKYYVGYQMAYARRQAHERRHADTLTSCGAS